MLPRDQRLDFGKKIISRVNSIGSYFSEVQAETFHWSIYKLYSTIPSSFVKFILGNWPSGNAGNRLFPGLTPSQQRRLAS